MRDIDVKEVTRAVAECCIDSCNNLPEGVLKKLEAARKEEISPLGCQVLDTIIENAKLANKKQVPLCQDTGLTVVYIDIGQEVHFTGGDLWDAIHAGVAKGYTEGYLRKSSVDDPIFLRKNTQDNTPAIIHCRIVPHRAGRKRAYHRAAQRLRQREHVPAAHAETGRRSGRHHQFCAGSYAHSGTQPLSARNGRRRCRGQRGKGHGAGKICPGP